MTVKEFLEFGYIDKKDITAAGRNIEMWLKDDEHKVALCDKWVPRVQVFDFEGEYIGRLDFESTQEFIDNVEVESFVFDDVHNKLLIFVDIEADEIIREEEGD